MTLDGFAPADAPLSPRAALAGLRPLVQRLVAYDPEETWEQDTRQLPRALRAYRRRARDFAQRVLAPAARTADLDPHGETVREVLRQGAEAGYLTDLLPAPLGTEPARLFRYPLQWVQSLKVEEHAAACAGLGIMLGAHGLGTMPILLSGDLGGLRRFVGKAYSRTKRGEPYLFAFAITEPGAGSDVEETHGAAHCVPGTIAKRAEGGWLLNGRKIFISGGDLADAVTVFASLENEGIESWTCFVVEKEMSGYRVVRTELKMGQRASTAAELLFEDVFVPDDHVVGSLRTGWGLNRATLNFSRIPVGAVALGIARGALETAIDFACSHRLGNKELIHYQEVQLAIAQMLADTTAMRALIWQAAQTFTPTQAKSALTKFWCADTAVRVCESAMELLGSHGFLHGGVEKRFRDARVTQIYEGTNQINRLAVIEDYQEQLLTRITAQK